MTRISSSEHLVVVGSTTPLAYELEQLGGAAETSFIGRDNPFGLSNWAEGESLTTTAGIEQVNALVGEQIEACGKQVVHLALLQGVSSRDWQESMQVNMVSVATIAESFAKSNQQERRSGSITLVGSASAYLGGKIPYAATKASLVGIMNSLNAEYGVDTRTNLVLPGAFYGGMTADWSEEKQQKVAERTYGRKIAAAADIAHAILFCGANQYVCGTTINMTAGQVK